MKRTYTDEQIAEVLSLKQQGLTIHQTAVRLNIPAGTVGTIIHRSKQVKAVQPEDIANLQRVSKQTGIDFTEPMKIIYNSLRSPVEGKKKPKEKPPKSERRELNVDQKKERNAAKQAQAQQRFDNAKIGDRITVFYPKGIGRVSGEVVAKYPRTLSIINDAGRHESITVADLMTYRVV
jgi:transcriptional regulator with XRE-family HTH domain